jgi:hypothetical protein
MEIRSTSQGEVIMALLKDKLGVFAFWKRIEPDLAIICAGLPEVNSEEKKKEIVVSLKKLKTYLMQPGVDVIEKDLDFLEDEIERYTLTKQISLYEEKDYAVDQEVINKYANIGTGTQGIVGIHLGYNYEQLKKLTNGVYKQTGLVKFYISAEKTLYGKVQAEIYEHPQKIPVATLIEDKQKAANGDPDFKRIALFGEKVNRKENKIITEMEEPFRVYRFITEHNQELILLSKDEIEIGDYVVTGVTTQVDDYKVLTETARLPTKLPFIFVKDIKSRIIRFKDHGEFRERLSLLGINKSTVFNFPFTVEEGEDLFVLNQPTWFKWLVWAWLTHARVGMQNMYPMHIMMVGAPGGGKSWMLNSLYKRSKEIRYIFSGSSSTLKNLVPSFKYKPAKMGYLADSNRFSFCDEFLRCILNTRSVGTDGSAREESVAMMNDLLEHQRREAGSGVSIISKVNMTSRVFATTNPVKGVNCMEDLYNGLDQSFLSRWLIYYQTQDHLELIRHSKQKDLKKHPFKGISTNEWISLLDYLHTFKVAFEEDRLDEILKRPIPMLSENLKKHYDTRHRHHLECLLDGIVKTRCLFEKDMSFNAREVDYKRVQEVWDKVIGSWIDGKLIKKLPVGDRVNYLPENCQYLFKIICEAKRPLVRHELQDMVSKDLTTEEYRDAHIILRDNHIIFEDEDKIKPFYMEETKE